MRPKNYVYTEQHKRRISESNKNGKGSSSPEARAKKAESQGFEDWKNKVHGFDKELAAFKRCHDRVRDGKPPSIQWGRDLKGFSEFVKELGECPPMEKPSVGRIDHNKGYQKGNIKWQEHKENSVQRKGTRYQSIAYKGEKK